MIQAQDFLDFARSLPRDNETDDRVCIGRAYYAAMHKALEYALKSGYQYDRKEAGGTHSNLIFYFEREGGEALLVVAELLKKLKYQRTQADYNLGDHIYSDKPVLALKRAENIFNIFNELK